MEAAKMEATQKTELSEDEMKELMRATTKTFLEKKVEEDVEANLQPMNPSILELNELLWSTFRRSEFFVLIKHRLAVVRNPWRILLRT